MPLYAAQKILNDENISRNELFNCIVNLAEEVGHLRCRCNKEAQLIPDLTELTTTLVQLLEKYKNYA